MRNSFLTFFSYNLYVYIGLFMSQTYTKHGYEMDGNIIRKKGFGTCYFL